MEVKKIVSFDAETDGLWGEVFAIGAVVYEWLEICPMVVKDANGKINNFHGRRWGIPSDNPNDWPTDPGPWHMWVQDGPLEWRWHRVAQFSARNTSHKIKNEWVKENVVRSLSNLRTYDNYESMIKAFAKFYIAHKAGAKCVTHMGYIVESHLLREMRRLGYIGEWDGPYSDQFAPWHDVSQDLERLGEDPSSVDAYAKKNSILVNVHGRGHKLFFADEINQHNPVDDAEIAARVFFHIQNFETMTENEFEMPAYPLLPRAGGGKDWPFGPRQLPPELMELVEYVQKYVDARTGGTPRQWQVMAFIAHVASKDLEVYLDAYTAKWNEENQAKKRK